MRKKYWNKEIQWLVLSALLVIICVMFNNHKQNNLTKEEVDKKVRDIYQGIVIQTGQSQDELPLVIDESNIINAYNDGTKIVIYRGLIDSRQNWDEIAMILAHEIAHGMLWHLKMPLGELSNDDVAVLEGNADKMGAFYALKAGWDVCVGREIFKKWREERGNYLGQNHPDFSYRFDELKMPWCHGA